ncbi:MAG: hypothetical protein ACRD2W_25060 [Acidimicrobiales bacterium]
MTLVVAVVAAACGGGDGEESGDGEEPTLTTAAAGTTGTTAAGTATTAGGSATNLSLRVTDVRLVNSEESDSGMRILLPAGTASASVTLTGVPSPNRIISVCQARELASRLSGATCRMPASGEAITLPLGSAASGVEIIQVGPTGSGPSGNSAVVDEVTIRYAASSRDLNVRFPQIASGDSGGRPAFTLTPPSTTGTYQANLKWTVIAVYGGTPTSAQLELVQGGNVANQAQNSAFDVRLNGTVSPPGEAAIRVQNGGTAALVNPTLNVTLP